MIKLGIVMDPIANINIKKDSSFAMLLEAQRRGYELHYMEMGDLYLINGEARAHTRTLNVKQNYEEWFSFVGEQDLPLADLDVILMRKDPPFDTEFIYATYILERAEEKGTLIVNKPQSLRGNGGERSCLCTQNARSQQDISKLIAGSHGNFICR